LNLELNWPPKAERGKGGQSDKAAQGRKPDIGSDKKRVKGPMQRSTANTLGGVVSVTGRGTEFRDYRTW